MTPSSNWQEEIYREAFAAAGDLSQGYTDQARALLEKVTRQPGYHPPPKGEGDEVYQEAWDALISLRMGHLERAHLFLEKVTNSLYVKPIDPEAWGLDRG